MSDDAKTTAAWEQEVIRLANINADLVKALQDMVSGFRLIADADYPALARARAALNKAGVTQ